MFFRTCCNLLNEREYSRTTAIHDGLTTNFDHFGFGENCMYRCGKCLAEFLGTPLAGVAPLTVSFSDLSTGTVTGWSWNFGDLATSIQQHPTHVYSDPGTFTVSLTVVGPGGATTETKANYVTVGAPSPAAEFSGTPRAGGSPLTVFFTDFSTGNVTSWNWTFGDGGSSTQPSPAHIYTVAGNYTVSLTVIDNDGGSGNTTDTVTVTEAPQFVDYQASGQIAVAGTVSGSFTDTQSDNGVSQSARERLSGGKKRNRYSHLEHNGRLTCHLQQGSCSN